MGLEAEILALRLKFEPGGWGLGLKTGIWALRMGFWPKGLGGGTQKEKEKKKFPLCESIGHRCPKAEVEMQQRQSWADLEAFLNVQGFQEAERTYDACDLDYAPADKKQKILSNFT